MTEFDVDGTMTYPIPPEGATPPAETLRQCAECGQSKPAHSRDDMGTCERFKPAESTDAMAEALIAYAEWCGGVHDDGCPADDTCSCSGKWINDGVTAAVNALASHARLRAALEEFLLVWDEVEPKINGYIMLNFARTGQQYDGKSLPVDKLRAALALPGREPEAERS